MLNELRQSIAISQDILGLLGPYSDPIRAQPTSYAIDVLADVASIPIPYIEDSRVPNELNMRLHSLTSSHFRNACLSLQHTHRDLDVLSLKRVATQLYATYTGMYERQVVKVSASRARPQVAQKQPYANDVLVYAFQQSQSPTRRERERLAALTGLSVEQVRVWFQNRRSRQKKKAPELQTHAPVQLPDLLERVLASSKATTVDKCTAYCDDFDDEHDSGYGSDSDCQQFCPAALTQRPLVSLSKISVTPRSYPAVYAPRPLLTTVHFDPPTWRRTPANRPRGSVATVTIDQLTRCMSGLTLRRRREKLRAPPPCASPAPADSVSSTSTKKQVSRKTGEHTRKLAGGRRVASAQTATSPAPHIPCSATAHNSTHSSSISIPSEPAKGRKRAGPPRRSPAGKALTRQASGSSVASASTSSSRSSSYASDFSIASIASTSSFTSVESDSVSPAAQDDSLKPRVADRQQPPDMGSLLLSYPPPAPCMQEDLPVYDLSAIAFDDSMSSASSSDLSALLNDPSMLQLLQAAHSSGSPTIAASPRPHQQLLDIGMANMDSLVDFSMAAVPTLEALLSDPILGWSMPQQTPHVAIWTAPGLELVA